MNGKPQPKVRCEVNRCVYWTDGNLCNAREIEVTGSQAREGRATDCATFALRGLRSMIMAAPNVDLQAAMDYMRGEEETEPNPQVTCYVDTCRYWTVGDACRADNIQISGKQSGREERTHCATFEPEE